jgi:hypothetical protein
MNALSFTGQQIRATFHYLPLISSPAVSSDPQQSYVNKTLIRCRVISGVALSSIALVGICWTCPAAALLATKHKTALLVGRLAIVVALRCIEAKRANTQADHLAAHNFQAQQFPSKQAMNQLISSPNAFQKLIELTAGEIKPHLQKNCRENQYNLIEQICYFGSLEVFKKLVEKEGTDFLFKTQADQNLFIDLLNNLCLDKLDYLFKSKKLKNIDELTQVIIWKSISTGKQFDLLSQYGFNLEAKDGEGKTPLMHWTIEPREYLVMKALNANANPLLTSNSGEKASDLTTHTLSKQRLLQAEKHWKNKPENLPQSGHLFSWKPFVLKEAHHYRVNLRKILLVTLPILTLPIYAASKIGQTTFAAKILAVGALSVAVLVKIAFTKAKEEIRRQAVVDFLTNAIPSNQAIVTIQKDPDAVRLLLKHAPPEKSYLNKIDRFGNCLLNRSTEKEAARLLIKANADVFPEHTRKSQNNGFFHAIFQEPDLLRLVLECNSQIEKRFSKPQQQELRDYIENHQEIKEKQKIIDELQGYGLCRGKP